MFNLPNTISFEKSEIPFQKVLEWLSPHLTEERKKKIDQVLLGRTFSVTPVIEGLYDLGNVSAVMRSAEALGFQQIHIIEKNEKFRDANRVSKGAEKWLNINRWKDTVACIKDLKTKGYKICSTSLNQNSKPINEIDFTQPTAIVFGNESVGISEEMLALSDEHCVFPMSGFTQSFNISVAAALCLFYIQQVRIEKLGFHGDLTDEQKDVLKAHYYFKSKIGSVTAMGDLKHKLNT